MQEIAEVLRDAALSFVTWLFTPLTVYGALGGTIRAVRRGQAGWKAVLFGMLGGITMSNVLGPAIIRYVPEAWQLTTIFLAGYGGLELAGMAYSYLGRAALRRLAKRINPDEQPEPMNEQDKR